MLSDNTLYNRKAVHVIAAVALLQIKQDVIITYSEDLLTCDDPSSDV